MEFTKEELKTLKLCLGFGIDVTEVDKQRYEEVENTVLVGALEIELEKFKALLNRIEEELR